MAKSFNSGRIQINHTDLQASDKLVIIDDNGKIKAEITLEEIKLWLNESKS